MALCAAADARLAAAATPQHGAFTRAQALRAGLSNGQIDRRLRAGTWVRVLPRVYRHVTTPRTTILAFWAAALWAGAGSALSHTSAGAVWRLVRDAPVEPEVLVARSRAPAAAGVVVHRSTLDAIDVRIVDGLPVTTPARTLIDLAAVLDDADLEAAVESARRRGLVVPSVLTARLDAIGASGRPGVARLRRVLSMRR